MTVADLLRVPAARLRTSTRNVEWRQNIWNHASNQGSKHPDHIPIATGLQDPAADASQPSYIVPAGADLSKIARHLYPNQANPQSTVNRNTTVYIPKYDTDGSLVLPSNISDSQISVYITDLGLWQNIWFTTVHWDDRPWHQGYFPMFQGRSLNDLVPWLPHFDPNSDNSMIGATLELVYDTDQTNAACRCPGVFMHLGVLWAEKVLAGRIDAAMAVAVSGLLSANGAAPKGTVLTDITDPRVCGKAPTGFGASASPANQLETKAFLVKDVTGMMPDATRWCLDPARYPAERILDMISDKKLTGQAAASFTTIVNGAIEFGFIDCATSGMTGGMSIYGNGSRREQKLWKAAGIPDGPTSNTFLDGVIGAPEDIRVLEAATTTIKGGATTTAQAVGVPSYPDLLPA